jgi:aldehyde:ferredoxin oxidoreductase
MKFGYQNKILRVNLSDNSLDIDEPDEFFYRTYLGGEGFVVYYLLKELEQGIDPLSPKNKLIFATGPVTGVSISGSGRNCVGAKSPLTNGFGEAEVGGYWGPELKRAGFDAIIVEGKSKDPIYLWIHDQKVEFRDAKHLWGKITGDAQELIKRELKDDYVHISQIGPGGEHLVKYACIINDLRNAAGRTGMGAVMGSKNLKAVVVRGHKKIDIANKEKLRKLRDLFNNYYLKPYKGYFSYGTGGGMMELFASNGNLPTKNFREGGSSQSIKLDPQKVGEAVNLHMETCYGCPIACKKVVSIKDPWNVNPIYGGPEYETIGAFGSNCGVYDFKVVCKGNEMCNQYSLDTISTGMSISFAMECFENGIINEEDTDGLRLEFGNSQALLEMVEKIAYRKGFGNILAEGVKRAAQNIGKGAEKYALHVKGQEIPMHEPRLKQGLGLGYTISPTGAEHMHNLHDDSIESDRGIMSLYPFGIFKSMSVKDLGPAKVRALMYQINWKAVGNSLIMCYFNPWELSHHKKILNAVTGWNTTTWEIMKIGERIMNLARIFNLREGLSNIDDTLPQRFFEPHTSGSLSTTKVDPGKLKDAKKIYYGMMGWSEDGIPAKLKLEELGIDWAFEKLNPQ